MSKVHLKFSMAKTELLVFTSLRSTLLQSSLQEMDTPSSLLKPKSMAQSLTLDAYSSQYLHPHCQQMLSICLQNISIVRALPKFPTSGKEFYIFNEVRESELPLDILASLPFIQGQKFKLVYLYPARK